MIVMNKEQRRLLCAYCGRWYEKETMTPLYQDGKPSFVNHYCEKCLDEVKSNIRSLPWANLYYFGLKGQC
jgi:hypothetical protein